MQPEPFLGGRILIDRCICSWTAQSILVDRAPHHLDGLDFHPRLCVTPIRTPCTLLNKNSRPPLGLELHSQYRQLTFTSTRGRQRKNVHLGTHGRRLSKQQLNTKTNTLPQRAASPVPPPKLLKRQQQQQQLDLPVAQVRIASFPTITPCHATSQPDLMVALIAPPLHVSSRSGSRCLRPFHSMSLPLHVPSRQL